MSAGSKSLPRLLVDYGAEVDFRDDTVGGDEEETEYWRKRWRYTLKATVEHALAAATRGASAE